LRNVRSRSECTTCLYMIVNDFSIDDWGFTTTQYSRPRPPSCPLTVQDVVDGAFYAIAGTLYNKQQPDPAAEHQSDRVTNKYSGSTNKRRNNVTPSSSSTSSSSSSSSSSPVPSLFSYRPLHSPPEAGRIGIELDGAEHMFHDLKNNNNNNNNKNRSGSGALRNRYSSRAQRRWALLLAMKLATRESWKDFEDDKNDDNDKDNNNINTGPSPYRLVVLSFNTLKEALLARGEMQYLQSTMQDVEFNSQVLDFIIIRTISDGVPTVLHRFKKRRRVGGIDYVVDPTRGIMILCSPTDYSREYEPPGPSLHSITDFQKTADMALLHEIPVVVLSPRFMSWDDYDKDDEIAVPPNSGGGGFSATMNQHGYQQAGYYGGKEPPRGMSPWLMRDFFPPSYSWISWLTTSLPTSRVIMTNSVMNKVCHMGLKNSFAYYESWYMIR
jgi:hypothetical protein